MKPWFRILVMLPFLWGAGSVWAAGEAQSAPESAQEAVRQATDSLLARLSSEREQINQDPEYLFVIVEEELVPFVDFKRIARLVMADYFKQASKEQKYRFLEVFKSSMIHTYAKGLAAYENQTYEIAPPRGDEAGKPVAQVSMVIHTEDGKHYPVVYSLYRNGDNRWQLQNIIINGVNLGKTYRNHFAQLMQQYGDIDAAIDNWQADVSTSS